MHLAREALGVICHAIARHLASARACHEELGTLADFRQYLPGCG
jgi:hypothetical protein